MDFHSLTRRELQALCKKNKIPANITSAAMVDALQSLDIVDGIEELLKSCESETVDLSSESLQTVTKSCCRARGKVGNEAKSDMLETPVPNTRRRAAATSVRAKLESKMKECKPNEPIVDQIEGEKKVVPKTPEVVLTCQRKDLKVKSSVRQACSTRRSARLAGKPMQETNKQENDKSGAIITFDALLEETNKSLVMGSKHYSSAHKNEDLEKEGIDSKVSESLEITNESEIIPGQDSNETETVDSFRQENGDTVVLVAIDTKAEEASDEVVPLDHNDNGSENEHISEEKVLENGKEIASGGMHCLRDVSGAKIDSGKEPMEESEIAHDDAVTAKDFQNTSQNLGVDTKGSSDVANLVLAKQLNEVDDPHYHDTSNFVAEKDHFNQIIEFQVNDGAECNNSDVAGKQGLMGKPTSVNPDTNMDFHEVNSFEQSNCEENVSEAEKEVAGEEEPMEENEVDSPMANVDGAADVNPGTNIDFHVVNSFGQFNRKEDVSEAKKEVAGEEEPMEENEVDNPVANEDCAAHVNPGTNIDFHVVNSFEQFNCEEDVSEAKKEVAGEEEPMEENEVPMEENEVDNALSNVDVAAHVNPDTNIDFHAVNSSNRLEDVSEAKMEVSGEEEPMEEYEVDNAVANVDGLEVARVEEHDAKANVDCESVGEELNKTRSSTKGGVAQGQSLHELSLRKLTKMVKTLHGAKANVDCEAVGEEYAKANVDCEVVGDVLKRTRSLSKGGVAGIGSKQSLHELSSRKLTKMFKTLHDVKANVVCEAVGEELNKTQSSTTGGVAQGQSLHELSLRKLTKMIKSHSTHGKQSQRRGDC